MAIPGAGLNMWQRRRRAVAFAGAYDATPNIAAAYSSRRLRSAYLGKAWRMRRDSDNDEAWIPFLGNSEHLDTAYAADFLNGASGYIAVLGDQRGTWISDVAGTDGHDATQSTASKQPLYVASGQNGRPVLRWDGVNDGLNASLGTLNAPVVVFTIGYFAQLNQAGPTNYDYLYSIGSSIGANTHIGFARWTGGDGNSDKYYLYEGASILYGPVLTGQAWKIYSQSILGSAPYHTLHINGTSQTVTDNNAAIATNGEMGIGYYRPDTSHFFDGDIAELIICNAALSTGDRQAAESAANSYWNIY